MAKLGLEPDPPKSNDSRVNSRLQDLSIVVVGGTTGMGLAAAKALVAEGAKLVVVGRNPDSGAKALEELGDNARLVTGDATDPTTAEQAVALAVSQFGQLDGLYHVAGGSGRKWGDGPLHELTDEGWQKTIDLNLTTLMNSNRAAVQQLRKQGKGGSILNMGSVLGFSPSPDFFSTHAYAATKAAAIGFTKSCAAYYAMDNIRFNLIAPALVETPMAQRAAQDQEILDFIKHKQPLDGGRIGKSSDLDEAAILFLSPGSNFITGQVLAVDGGWTHSEGGPKQ